MKLDFGSNFLTAIGKAPTTLSAGTLGGVAVDHKNGPSAAFIVSCGTFATSLVAKLQYSSNASDWTDEPTPSATYGYPGNDVSVTFATANTVKVLKMPNPRARYTRCFLTAGGACVASVINVVGPKRSIDPADAALVS